MIKIKSLNKINEGLFSDNVHDIRYKQDIVKANEAYDKVAGTHGPLSMPRKFRWLLTPNKKVAEAAYDRSAAIKAAEARREAGKLGMASKQDLDEAKFQAAQAQAKLRAKAAGAVKKQVTEEDKPGIFRKIGGAIAEHPYIAAGTVAGLAGLAALQKRKKREPEPGQY